MVNARTLRGLRQALLDCVPGKAQRRRLLDALSRVPGNRAISQATSWLLAREEDSPSRGATRAAPPPPQSGTFRTRVITYTQSPPEVQVTMSRSTADALRVAMEGTRHLNDLPAGANWTGPEADLYRALLQALDRKAG